MSNASKSLFTGHALFMCCVALYFTWQIVLRLVLGGALETDEAEMMVMTPGFRLGYGPQLPLYNWLQVALFSTLGTSLFTLALLKNLLLAGTYVLTFIGLRLWVPTGLAAIGALSLFTIPDVAWEAQRATTHSNMLLLTCAATLSAFLWVAKTGRPAAFVALGIAVGLGGLAKYNYVLVPLCLICAGLTVPLIRARLLSVWAFAVPAIAGAILYFPYRWMVENPELAFSSTGKLAVEESTSIRAEGVLKLLEGMAVLWVLPALICAVIFAVWRMRPLRSADKQNAELQPLLWRATLIATFVVMIGVPAAGVGHITPRWLLPVVFLGVPALFLEVFARVSERGARAFFIVIALLAILVSVGLGVDRYKDTARRAVLFDPLSQQVNALVDPNQTLIIAEFYTAGNLARLNPSWTIAPYLSFASDFEMGDTVLFLRRHRIPPSLNAALRQAGWPENAQYSVLAEGEWLLPHDSSDIKTTKISYALVRFVSSQ